MRSKTWSEEKLPLEFAEELLNNLDVKVNEKNLQSTNEAFYGFLTKYSMYHFTNEEYMLCGICANTGEIDTTDTAVSPRKIKAGGKYHCFCPLGRASREDDYETIKSPFVFVKKSDL